ncbi:MAG: mannose-phosphate guanylyltransferase [Acidimicrobiia bacterium]|nr:mannose-phosphate guanylyltransferase [Acidimicrobiia bacterium]
MRAIVLVGGFGTRLRPLTMTRPKQMLPVLDRPMIEWVIERLVDAGVEEVVLSLGYLPDAFRQAYPDQKCAGAALRYAVESSPLDTAGAIRFAAAEAGLGADNEPFLVVNGDVIADLDLPALLALHRDAGAEATIALTRVEDPSRYGVVPIDDAGRVEAFIEKPAPEAAPSHWINAGAYVLEPTVVDRIPPDRRVSIERETFPQLVAARSLFARQDDAYWIDAGTPATYLQVQLDLLSRVSGMQANHVAATAAVAPTATVARSVVMDGAHVAPQAFVAGSVLLPGAEVCKGARVVSSIVGAGARIGTGADLDELCVVGDGVTVPDDLVLRARRLPDED